MDPADECRVFRLIRTDWVVDGARPSSQAFADHRESGKMSVYLEDEITAAGFSPNDLTLTVPEYHDYLVCWWTAGVVRALGQVIERDPNLHFPGHALIADEKGKRSAGTRKKLATAAQWLIGGLS